MKIHSKKDIFYYYKYLFLVLIPLIIFGICKNGILIHSETSNTYLIIKPLIYFIINFVIGFILDFMDNKKITIGRYIVYLTILFMISSINTPIWLYILGDIILIILIKFDKDIVNKIALSKLIVLAIMYLLKIFSFTNIIESSGKYLFSFMDLLIKGQVGGIASCNLILVIILLISLIPNIFYKRNISLISIVLFAIYFVIISIIYEPSIYLKLLINSTVLFELIIVAPINNYSPRTIKGEVTYAILLGIVTALFSHILNINIGSTLAITLLSPLRLFFDKNRLFS